MDDFMLDETGRTIRDRTREFVRTAVDPEYLRRMDLPVACRLHGV